MFNPKYPKLKQATRDIYPWNTGLNMAVHRPQLTGDGIHLIFLCTGFLSTFSQQVWLLFHQNTMLGRDSSHLLLTPAVLSQTPTSVFALACSPLPPPLSAQANSSCRRYHFLSHFHTCCLLQGPNEKCCGVALRFAFEIWVLKLINPCLQVGKFHWHGEIFSFSIFFSGFQAR